MKYGIPPTLHDRAARYRQSGRLDVVDTGASTAPTTVPCSYTLRYSAPVACKNLTPPASHEEAGRCRVGPTNDKL